jgi:hypothetical protein
MSPEIHQRVRKLFDEALERPEGERTAFLESAAGGEPEVRQAVERLLEAHRQSDGFLAGGQAGGRRLGRYILSRELGRGSMGVVFEGVDPLIGRHVAVKVIRIDPLMDAGKPGFVREQLFREAQSAGRLLHPGIVVIFDVGQQGDAAFIAMELVDGGSVQDLLAANRRPPVPDALEILRQAAAALDYAHQNGIVHRDIKPANIMLHKGNTVKVADFGVAKIVSLNHLTATGLILGTPTYMSPEQLEAQPLDGRSDQFSLAVVAYELLTGSLPFEADSLARLAHLIVYAERPSARALNPDLGEAACAVLRKGLAKLPDERYPTCLEFVAALADALREAPRAAIPAPVPVAAPVQVAAPAPVPVPAAASLAVPASAPAAPSPAPKPKPAAPTAAPAPKSRTVVWVIAGFLGVAAMLAAGLWVYRTAPWKSRPAPTALEPRVAPPVAPVAPPVEPRATPPAPTVARFAANPESLVAGNTARLQWEVKDSTEVRIDPQVGAVSAAGAVEIKPAESTTYTLTAEGPGGERSASLSIEVLRKTPDANPPVGAKTWYENGLAERKAGHAGKALANFRQAAEMGDVRAMLEVAEAAWDADTGESERWFRKAAELGDSTAMLNLGAMYQLGNHVKEDYARAAFWYRQASEKGNAAAMYNLGRMFERGRGVAKDAGKARELYERAAAKGNSEASAKLAQMTGK